MFRICAYTCEHDKRTLQAAGLIVLLFLFLFSIFCNAFIKDALNTSQPILRNSFILHACIKRRQQCVTVVRHNK